MRLHTTKTTAVCASALALVLPLTACGSSDDAASGGLSTAAEAPGSAETSAVDGASSETADVASETTTPEGSTATETTRVTSKNNEKKNDKTTAKKENQAAGNQGEAPTIANPFENGMPKNTNQPLASGKEGSEADRKQMEEVVRKVTNPESFSTWTRTILDNSCAAVRQPALEEFERQGLTLDMVEQMMRAQEAQGGTINIPKTDVKVTDVRIDGNRASATVSTSNSEGNASQVQLFAKEDGRWKVCNG